MPASMGRREGPPNDIGRVRGYPMKLYQVAWHVEDETGRLEGVALVYATIQGQAEDLTVDYVVEEWGLDPKVDDVLIHSTEEVLGLPVVPAVVSNLSWMDEMYEDESTAETDMPRVEA